ncbi:excinuclease ABC subunit UvrB [Helcococcus ovis]|uniref:excinuclease ABC subunit UvrB n=1 Tax=Helcococcus ovis TaxID=72026 RepID=UPI00106F6F5B|nr:excinuclease ABC subunit UvrB [Helcococcus ovis]TFF68702.1 excinuclease ABC subunit UvrB [Helcococcus ovis]WNZ01643.1 excinuclease ABC subunit UvrB [Helcococcus ovis]
MTEFNLQSKFKPMGDQSNAIKTLVEGLNNGDKFQTLKGVTGSGKTFTMANIIQNVNRPTLVLAHNKTLAYQLFQEFKEFFPNDSVEYFVSYYDYYQPEAYVFATDTYIAKDSSINDEIDKMRHSATAALYENRNVIIVASVSCIYGLGDPIDYEKMTVSLRPGMEIERDEVLKKLINIQFMRNDIDFSRGTFRVRGDIVDIFPANATENIYRVEFFGDEIDRISELNYLTGEVIKHLNHIMIFPASHYATSRDKISLAVKSIGEELQERLKWFNDHNKLLEAQRLEQRTTYDIEMLTEVGFVSGIENYSRHLSQRAPGSRPFTLLDYFPKDWLLLVDESHVTLPQVRGMYEGDRSRKQNLVDYGFRLPSALDNRPLKFNEFEHLINQAIFVSATPGEYEKNHQSIEVEQVIRPTGLLDPIVEVRPTENQIDDLFNEITENTKNGYRTLVTTLTKRMAEDLTDFMKDHGINVTYLHSDIDTIERVEILRDLRLGKYDVLVGINLLREGLDLPEVSLIAIMDADKEGFLRSETSLIQTIGRAARNENGRVIMYGDSITKSMNVAITETNRRRKIQEEYNRKHNIKPKSIIKEITNIVTVSMAAENSEIYKTDTKSVSTEQMHEIIVNLEKEMISAAEVLDFEKAANLRDQIRKLKKEYGI